MLADGTRYLDITPVPGSWASVVTTRDGSPHLVSLVVPALDFDGVMTYLLELEDGKPVKVYVGWEAPYQGVSISDRVLISNANARWEQLMPLPTSPPFSGWLPTIIDLGQGDLSPIVHPFFDAGFPAGRNLVRAVQQGPFARVVNTGSCLNVRAAPDTSAPVLECVADGVLLRLGVGNGDYPGEVHDAGGGTWLSVLAPSGVDGFASAEYLER